MRTAPPLRIGLCVLLFLTACSASPSEQDAPWQGVPYEELVGEAIADARDGGAGSVQLELLAQPAANGELPLETARIATVNAIDCFDEVGGSGEYVEETLETGLVLPGYVVGFDETLGSDHIDALVGGCEARESHWINKVYQLQPVARELQGQYVMSKEPELRACLEREGEVTDPDAHGWDLAHIALELALESSFEVDCLGQANISGL